MTDGQGLKPPGALKFNRKWGNGRKLNSVTFFSNADQESPGSEEEVGISQGFPEKKFSHLSFPNKRVWVAVGGVGSREMWRRRGGDDSHRDSQAYVISEKAALIRLGWEQKTEPRAQ